MKELKWMKGILYEVAFWNATYKRKASREWILNDAKLNHEIELHNFDAAAFLRERMLVEENPLVLDIGCGMTYFTGNLLGGKPINMQFVDPLAHFYNDILEKYKVTKAPRITFGMMEYLSAFYPEKDVSLAIIQNALDHSENPIKGIIQSLAVLKPGGILYLKHYPNEAEKEQYRGFHQFNITIEDGCYIIWNKDNRVNVNELVKDFAEVEVSTYDNPDEIIAVIRKTAEVPDSLLTPLEDVRKLSTQLMLHAKETHSFRNMASYHTKKPVFNMGQYMMRFVELDNREKIKKVLRKFKK